MQIIKTAIITIVGSVLACGAAAAEASGAAERLVSVQGHGKLSAPPDIARLWVQVSEEGARLDSVSAQARQKMELVLKVLKAQGINDKDIQTQSYQVAPKMEWKNGRSDRVGYIVSNQVAVVVRDLRKTGAVLSAVVEAGANNVSGPQFEIENPQPLERKALQLALDDAKAKAAVLAQGAGASLGPALTIQEGQVFQPGPRPVMMRSLGAKSATPEQEPIATGEETIQATISASFALK